MRIMLLAPGSDIHPQRFLRWLERAGCTVLFVDDTRPENLDPSRSSFLIYPRGVGRLGKKLVRFNDCSRYLQLRFLWRKFEPDVVHVHNLSGSRQYDCFKARLRPLVLSCYGPDIHKLFVPKVKPLSRIFMRHALTWADHVFADSQDVLQRCKILARRPISSSILYFGIDTRLFRPGYAAAAHAWRRTLAIPRDAKVLLSVRAWRPEYRHELILEAFTRAKRSLPYKSVLIFKTFDVCGRGTTYEEEVRGRARTLGVESSIRWMSRVPYEQMPELYSFADLVVNFPRWDGFPVSFFEAAACGTPVVTNQLPAYEGIGLERFFRMVPADNADELSRAMVEALLEPPQCLKAKGEIARKWAEESGDEEKSVEALLAVYRRLSKRYRKRPPARPTRCGSVGNRMNHTGRPANIYARTSQPGHSSPVLHLRVAISRRSQLLFNPRRSSSLYHPLFPQSRGAR